MINFNVLNRFSGEVQFTAKINCGLDACHSMKLGLAVKWAIKYGADLKGANLEGANLKWVVLKRANLEDTNLEGANLEGADFSGANLKGAALNKANIQWALFKEADLEDACLNGVSGINEYVKCIQIETYSIAYTSDVIQIGCECHSLEEWQEFDNARIAEMGSRVALKFWKKYKNWIFQTIELCPAKSTEE